MGRASIGAGRRAQVVGMLGAGLMAAIGLATPSLAQTEPLHSPPAGAETSGPKDDGSAALAARIAALEARIARLEADADKEKPVKAPFSVVDGGGRAIFTVSADGGGLLTLGSSGSSIKLSVNGGARLDLASGGSTATMNIDGEGPHIGLAGGGQTFAVGPSGGNMMLSVIRGDASIDLVALAGQPMVSATAGGKTATMNINGEGPHLSLVDSGQSLVAGINGGDMTLALIRDDTSIDLVARAGAPLIAATTNSRYVKMGAAGNSFGVVVAANDMPVARLDSGDGQGGKLSLFEGSDEIVSVGSIQGSKGLVVNDGGAQVFAGMPSDADPQVWIARNKNTLAGLEPSLRDDSAGSMFVSRANDRRVMMDAGPAPGMRVYAAQEPVLSAYVGEDGVPGLNLYHGKDPVAELGGSTEGPSVGNLTLFNKGAPMLTAGDLLDGSLGLQVFDKGDDPAINLSVVNGTPGLYINKEGNLRAFVGMENSGDPSIAVFGASSRLGELTTQGENGTLVLYDGGTRSISLGPTKEKASAAFRAYDKGNMVFAAGVSPIGTGALVAYGGGQIGAGLEGSESGGGNVYVMSKGNPVASINSVDKSGQGVAVIRNPGGVAVATLGLSSSGDGGNVTTTNPSGFGVFSAGYASDGAGEACVNRKTQAGTERPACIGLGLPSAGMGK